MSLKKIIVLLSTCMILSACAVRKVKIETINEEKLDNLLLGDELYYLYYADKEIDETKRVIELIQAHVDAEENMTIYLFDLSPYDKDPEKLQRITQKYGVTHSTYIQKRQGEKVLDTFVWSELPYNGSQEEIMTIKTQNDGRLLKFFLNSK